METKQVKTSEKNLGSEFLHLLKANVRDYMMYIALVIIMLFFTWKT